jgi:serine/threonine protein kinase
MTAQSTGLATISGPEFAQNLADSGLSNVAELMSESDTAPSGNERAKQLVAVGKLTRYQADAILERRFADLRTGNYEILDRLGAGGMGTVFKARHRRMKRIVALKVLSREAASSRKFVQRFQREVETIARLSHPNIVMAFDADEGEAGPFLVMEFVNGQDLTAEVAAGGPMRIADAVDRILQAARGLEYAHAQGIVHRDIKPGNLLRDADGVVKVADLGLARLAESSADQGDKSSLTTAGTVVGTVDYMSPEQADDSGTIDHRADIYSLGCTLYYLLTGSPPYAAASVLAILLKHRDAPIPSLTAARPDVPSEVESIFRRMLAKRPDERIQSMTELIRELEQARAKIKTGDESTPVPSPRAAAVGGTWPTVALDSPLASSAAGTFDLSWDQIAQPASEAGQSLSSLVVVVAEPSRTQAGIIRKFLQQLGIAAIHSADSGRQLIETAKKVRPDVVISSLHLSDMTGVQLVQTLRSDPACATLGFVLATSETDSELASGIPQDQRTVVMPKPFDLKRLSQALAAVACQK